MEAVGKEEVGFSPDRKTEQDINKNIKLYVSGFFNNRGRCYSWFYL